MTGPDHPLDPKMLAAFAQHPLTRRRFLRAAGVGAAGISLASLLAACGGGDGATASGPSGAATGFDWGAQEKTGSFTFGNWPFYMDKGKVDGEPGHPSLARFTQDTGIEVDYQEVIQDYGSFFTQIQPVLAADQSTGLRPHHDELPEVAPADARPRVPDPAGPHADARTSTSTSLTSTRIRAGTRATRTDRPTSRS